MEIKNTQKWVFLKALVLTLIIFNIGIFLGYMLEHSRVDKINTWYLDAEMELLDQRIQQDSLDLMDLNCDKLVQENVNFADKIYSDSLQIEKFESVSQLDTAIIFQHKRYDLLRTLFWMNSIRIKEKCNSDYHNVVYFYKYENPTIEQKSKQRVFSKILSEVKQKQGNKIMLIPIAGDNNLSSVDLLADKFGITQFPTILIDEKTKITSLESPAEIEKYLN